MSEPTLTLSPPAYITLATPDGAKQVRIDVYAARRALDDAGRQPTQELHHKAILTFIASKLDINPDDLAENQALELNDYIVKRIEELNRERQKKTLQNASSPTSIPESPATSNPGP